MNSSYNPKFVCLAILDGWGIAPRSPGNAIELANTPNMDRLWASFPKTQLKASGEAVGLPKGEVGNTETGHLNLGAGRIVYQDLARINMSIADGSFFENKVIYGAIEHAKKNNSNLHLMGLIGAGGVHSNIEHLFALLQFTQRNNFDRVFIHLFTDGRDSPPTSSKVYLSQLRNVIQKERCGVIASIMGRFWAMDRDLRWERTAKAYFALTQGKGHLVKTPEEAIELSYSQGKTDEFVEPSIISDNTGKPVVQIGDGDSIIFFNFRVDRPRQLSRSFILKDFESKASEWGFDPYIVHYQKKHIVSLEASPKSVFERGRPLQNLYFATMTEYEKLLVDEGAKVIFPPEIVQMPLGRVISEAGLPQLRLSESEKERFVSFYFNGLNNQFDGEDKVIVSSPKVPTYDLKPEMSTREITSELLARLKDNSSYAFILVNFANPDMVSHTGNIGATVTACQVADECIGKISDFILNSDGYLIVTADHGNAEEMINPHTGEIDTEHSSYPVPLIIVSKNFLGKSVTLEEGILADVAPTIISLMGLTIPSSMTGRNLLSRLS